MKKLTAEFIGTLVLVFFGCGSAIFAGTDHVGQLGISFAFGIAIIAMAYAIGPISGCHVNPAVSLAAFIAKRMSFQDMTFYWVAQLAGALAGAFLLSIISKTGMAHLGENGWGPGYLGEYSVNSAFYFEILATAIFVIVILGATDEGAAPGFAGLAIGMTLVAIHIVGIQITGVSVNPARSFGPAVLVGGTALSQLWLFILAPLMGAAIGGALYRFGLLGSAKA